MLRRIVLVGIALLFGLGLSLGSPPQAQSQPDQPLFGPTQYLRTNGAPNEYTETVTVPASVGAPFRLHIVNGEADGSHRLSSAWLTVNGVQVAGPADFGQQVAVVDRPLTLQPTNQVRVTVASKPDGYLTISLFGTKILPTPTALTPNPLTITAGSTGTLTATLAPIPTHAGSLTVGSANPSVAAVPASVPFAINQTGVPIPVTAAGVGATQITVSLNGAQVSSTVQVTPAPPTVTSVLPSALTITQGGTGALTVTINAAQATDTTVALASSAPGIASTPGSVIVPAGQTAAPIPVSANTPGTAAITASLNDTGAGSTVTVTPALPTIVSLLPPTSQVMQGASAALTVTISAAQPTPTTIAVTAGPAGILTVPATVVVPAGQLTAPVPFTAVALGTAMVHVSLNSSMAEAAVQVTPPPPAVVSLLPSPLPVVVGGTGTLTVTINVAQLTGTDVTLTVDNQSLVQAPAGVTVPAGQIQVSFTVTGLALGQAVVTASVGSSSQSATVQIQPPPPTIVSLLPNPLPLQQGATGTLTVTISAVQLSDTVVALSTDQPTLVQAPSSATVPTGQTSAPIPVTGLLPGTATVTATLHNSAMITTIQVTEPPPVVTALAPVPPVTSPLILPKGKPGVLRVTLSRAPTDPTAVSLTSGMPEVATVPASVTVPAGALFADFPVLSAGVGSATITATLNGGSVGATVVVTAPEVVLLTLSHQAPTFFIGQSEPFTATGTFTDGTIQDLTTQVTWTSSNESVATITGGGLLTALTAGTTTITASFTNSSGPPPITAGTEATVQIPPALTLSAPSATVQVGGMLLVTVTTDLAAIPGDLTVTLTHSGSGQIDHPATVVIPMTQTSATFNVTGLSMGAVILKASAPIRTDGTLALTVIPGMPAITGFSPASGQVGTTVTISGSSFHTTASENLVKFNGVAAAVTGATGTTLTATVPSGATTGPITVTTAQGTGTSAQAFTVLNSQPVLAPIGNRTVPLGATLSFTATATDANNDTVTFAVTPLPLPPHAAFDTQTGVFTFTPDGGQVGTFVLTFIAGDGAAASSETLTIAVTGAPAGGVTSLTGRVDDTARNPVANVPVALKGTAIGTTTAADGTFTLSAAAMPTGRQQLVVTGFAQAYANLVAPVDVIANVANQLPQPLTLPPVDMSTAVTVNPAATTVVQSATLNVSVTIPPHRAKNANGTDYTGVLTISPVPEYGRVEARPIELRPGLSVTIQPAGVIMDPPAPITFPNVDNMAPGNELDLWSLSPDTGTFHNVGRMRVSADGAKVETIAGGVRQTAWHFALAVTPTPTAPTNGQQVGACQTCDTGSGADLEEGALRQDVAIPGVRTLGATRDLTLHYRSTSADVRPILSLDAFLSVRAAVPQTFSARLIVGGIRQGQELFWNAAGLPESADSTSRLGIPFDASTLPTGRYPYEVMLFSNYPQSSIGGGVTRQTLIRNERASPFGAGWTLAGLDRLVAQADGQVVLAKGAGDTALFQPTDGALVVESFDLARGGNFSFVAGSIFGAARNALLDPANFGSAGVVRRPVQFRAGLSTVTTSALAGVHVFVLSHAGPVSASEVAALEQFVQEGGMLLEAESFAFAPRPVILGTFPGSFVGDGTSDILASAAATPVIQGPFGTVTSPIATGSSSAFAVTGAFTSIAESAAGPNILLLQPGPGFSGTGRAALFGDSEFFASGFSGGGANLWANPNNQRLFLNTLAFAAGAPGFQTPPPAPGVQTAYLAPTGDFSTLIRHTDGTFTRRHKDGALQTFNAQGLQTSVTDRNGNVTAYAYDEAGLLTSITDPAGLVTTFAYSGARLVSLTDPAGRVTQFQQDADGNLTAVTYQDNSQVAFAYDPQRRLTRKTDARHQVTQYAYDYAGRFSAATLPTGEVRRLTPSQRLAVPDIDAGQGTQSNPAPLAAPLSSAAFQDGNGRTSTFALDPLGRITQQTDALNRVTLIERDGQGHPAKITRPNGAVTVMTYDAKGNLLTTTEQAIAATTTLTYEPTFNQVTTIKDPKNTTTTITYDTKGNPLTIKDAQNNQTTLTYDSRGLVLTTKDTLNQTMTFAYDAQGRLLTTTDPLNRTTTLTYDGAGNVATSTDALNRVTTFEYDAFNRLKKVTDPASGVTEYTYDGNGNLVAVKDAKNQTTTFAYDARNRLASTTDPLGKTESYTYDGADNLLTRLTPKGEIIAFEYDAVNQLKKKTLPGKQLTTYAYDLVGNLTGVTDPDSVLTMTYDLANRLLTTSTAGSSSQPSVSLSYTYDKNGNRLTLVDPTATNTYAYDVLNRLATLTSPVGAVSYAYDALSRRTAVTLPNGTQTTYTYDPASQVTAIRHTLLAISSEVNKADYGYNNVGNRTSLTDRRGTQALGYDPLDRLISATHPLTLDQTYAYDAVGNRTSGGGLFNAGNQQTEDNTFLYEYDANGNQTKRTHKTSGEFTVYTYDPENRLTKVEVFASGGSTPVATSTYRYDGLGRRIEKTGNGQTRRYVYDGEDILLEYDETNALLARYTHGPGIDEPVAMVRGGASYFYHQDGLGSVTELTDGTGATAKAYAYDAYGNIVEQTGTVENPYAYTGRELDADTGLYYYRARYYDPRTGRFLQKDPIGFKGGINYYVYARDNPIQYADPKGLDVTVTLYPYGAYLFGHVGVGVNTSATVGFYPENSDLLTGLKVPLGLDVPGAIKPDIGMESKTVTIRTSPEQDKAMQAAINTLAENPGSYNLFRRNCTAFAAYVLRAGGLLPPSTIDPFNFVNQLPLTVGGPLQ